MSINWNDIVRDAQTLVDEIQDQFSPPQLETIQNFLKFECYLALESIYDFLIENKAVVSARHRREILRLFRESGFHETEVHEQQLEQLEPR